MPWDPSIPLQGTQQPVLPNPLELLTGIQALREHQNKNLQFQLENDARVGIGDAYSKAVAPDGSLDEAKLMDLLKANPATQFKIPEALAAAQAREKERQAIQQNNLALGAQRLNMFANTIGGLLVAGDDVKDTDVHRAVSKLALQINDPALAKSMFIGLADMPKGGKPLKDWLMQQQAAVMPVVERVNAAVGAPIPVDTGDGIQMVSQNKLSGQVNKTTGTGSDLEKFPTPAERNAAGVPRTDLESGAPKPNLSVDQERQLVGGRGTPVNVPSEAGKVAAISPPKAQENLKTMGDYWDYREELNKNLSSGEAALMQMRSMRNLMDLTRQGAGQETRMKVATVLSALGQDSLAKLVNGGDLFAAQEFAKKSFQSAYESLKLMSPPGTQLTQGEVLTNWENSARNSMDPRAIEGLFNFATKVFNYKQEEREFYRKWEGAPKDARAAWTDYALQHKLIEPEIKDRGGPPGITTPRMPFSRGSGVPPVGTLSEQRLQSIPDGGEAEFTHPSGQRFILRRNGQNIELSR